MVYGQSLVGWLVGWLVGNQDPGCHPKPLSFQRAIFDSDIMLSDLPDELELVSLDSPTPKKDVPGNVRGLNRFPAKTVFSTPVPLKRTSPKIH